MRVSLRPTTGQFTRALTRVPQEEWPPGYARVLTNPPAEVWRSRDFLLMVFEDHGYTRLSVLHTTFDQGGRFADGITWDELQQLKRQCGRGEQWAVECYPADTSVVNVQNMRHLWLLDAPPPYGWQNR